MLQVRLSKTQDINNALSFLQRRYPLMSEAEILKMALSEKYYKDSQEIEQEKEFRKMYAELKSEGKKLGNKLLQQKGLKRDQVNEGQFHTSVLDPNNA